MIKAIKNLNCKLLFANFKKVDFLILDGNFKIDLPIPQKSIVKGDEKVLSCAMASIVAKVTRDKIMEKYAKEFPKYGFEKHKGYPTKFHLRMLKKHGPCKIHRKSFGPVKRVIENF
jgi:ribonuclease HII